MAVLPGDAVGGRARRDEWIVRELDHHVGDLLRQSSARANGESGMTAADSMTRQMGLSGRGEGKADSRWRRRAEYNTGSARQDVRNMHRGGENDVTNGGEDAATRGPHLSTPHSRVPSIAIASAPPARAKWPRLATSHALRACPARCRDRRRDAISLPVTATRAQCTTTPTTAQGEPRRSTAEPTVGFVSVTATKSTGSLKLHSHGSTAGCPHRFVSCHPK